MKIYRTDCNEYEWWIHHDGYWWYGNKDMLGHIWQWVYYGGAIGCPHILNESSKLEYLVVTGQSVDATFQKAKEYI